jgi:hypothetical protein
MARRDKKPAAGDRLGALFALGDARGARAEARRLLAGPGASEADREAARAALARAAPERTAAWAALAGLMLFALAAYLGLTNR